jgi:hypothetical protein
MGLSIEIGASLETDAGVNCKEGLFDQVQKIISIFMNLFHLCFVQPSTIISIAPQLFQFVELKLPQ